ncbi:guanine nucleotide binding protein (G-protein), alpha subunit [Kipferlia bialata]|uniref:Guanine nucleotide binding protein (G-protein), alpha subunit n=1 Tax=Kipferlia bialata TaxID=797122 RepID=A0A9K3CTT4_9EUKA|nr:guanine nucleotide binding protein (G-protein), alpha subunit [Kipferlia bialata]|eukprot:g3024.t1
MQMLYLQGTQTRETQARYVGVVYFNVLRVARTLIAACQRYKVSFSDPAVAKTAAQLWKMEEGSFSHTERLPQSLARGIYRLWQDPGVQEVFRLSHAYALQESADHFMDNVVSFSEPSWMPTPEDILLCRVVTTEIKEIEFQMDGTNLKMIDVGGQRSERRKYLHCFTEVDFVLYVCALSDYDRVLGEDHSQNAMAEALMLYQEILDSRWFRDKPVILFLNKADIMAVKIKHVPMATAFPEYRGPASFQPATMYIKDRFVDMSPQRLVYPFVTTATDTSNVKKVFECVKDQILRGNMSRFGLV